MIDLKDKLSLLPMEPGCYLMKNKHGEIIYVGKAKNLKSRVSSYFTGAHDHKTTQLVANIVDFEYIITSTEKESFILEINLIKQHRPRYNIMFMDDKSYPYIKLNKEGRPNLIISRDKKMSKKHQYFGPYPDAGSARKLVDVLNHSVPVDGVFKPNMQAVYDSFNRSDKRYSVEELDKWRKDLISILNGNIKDFRNELENQMYDASDKMNYELAQKLKHRIESIDITTDKQQVQFNLNEQFDLFSYAIHQSYIAIVGLFVRNGRLLEKNMAIEATLEDPEDAFVSFISQFYGDGPYPKLVYVPNDIDIEIINEILNTEVKHAIRGKKKTLMEIAHKNATKSLEDQYAILDTKLKYRYEALDNLRRLLNIPNTLHRIEIFDNSHISGNFTVSACVVYDDGEPNKDEYRKYKLNSGNDDTASMREVVYRRYLRLMKENKPMPDLILIDGGKGQVNAAVSVLRDLDLNIPIAGLAKDEYHRTSELISEYGEVITIKNDPNLFTLLGQMQDEVHRYVITFHKSLRKKAMTKSILDEVEGLGPKRQKLLYKEFKSLKGMREASVETLSTIIPETVAIELYRILHMEDQDA